MATTLTNREMLVLRYSCLQTKDLAKVLNLSYKTVKKYQQTIRQKLGVKNSRQAMVKVMRLGLLKPDQFPLNYERGL